MQRFRLPRVVPTGSDDPVSQINVVLADYDPISRHVLSDVLGSSTQVRLTASVDAQRPFAEWPLRHPDVVVLAVGSLAGHEQLVQELVSTRARLVVMTSHWTGRQLVSAMSRGVAGCLVKKVDIGYLIPAVVAAASGSVVLSDELVALHAAACQPARQAADEGGDGAEVRYRLNALTKREREVLGMLTGGMTTDEVARSLTISPTTVKSHVSHSLPKLGVRNRMEAVLLMQRLLSVSQ